MKKIFAIVLLTMTLGANAFWGNNGWGGGNDNYGWSRGGNSIFGYNPYNIWDPRWYFEVMDNAMDEFDNNGWGNGWGGNDWGNGWGNNSQGNNGWNDYARPSYYGGYGTPYNGYSNPYQGNYQNVGNGNTSGYQPQIVR